jgi:hypothetical protein
MLKARPGLQIVTCPNQACGYQWEMPATMPRMGVQSPDDIGAKYLQRTGCPRCNVEVEYYTKML